MGWLARLIHRANRARLWLTRPLTVGVRVILTRQGEHGLEVLLVRHTYHDGWLLPGGGVNRGETLEEAACREVREETGVEIRGPLRLHGVFTNFFDYKSDHVIVFSCDSFRAGERPKSMEIADTRFFPLDALPEDVLPGHRRRIEEVSRGDHAAEAGLW